MIFLISRITVALLCFLFFLGTIPAFASALPEATPGSAVDKWRNMAILAFVVVITALYTLWFVLPIISFVIRGGQ